MSRISRREFVRQSSAAGILLTTGAANPLVVSPRPMAATDRVVLGKTKLRPSFLAFGTGVNGYNQTSEITRMGLDKGAALLRYGVERGINFIDMADLYGSHQLVPMALKDIPREDLVLLTKVWPRPEDWFSYSGGAKAEVDRFRKELDTDYLDIVLLHCLMNDRWLTEQKRAMDELNELKEQGIVKAVGVSCHHFGAMEIAASHPWVDVILARINHMGGREYSMDGTANEVAAVLKTARANGKAIVGMKIYGIGRLTQPNQMNTSLSYVVDNGLVDAITIGMLRKEEIDDNLTRIEAALRG